jgi:cobalamin biosynthetic protein CobC
MGLLKGNNAPYDTFLFRSAARPDIAWQDAMRERLIAEATSFDQRLASFGLLASGACPLFRLITTPDASHLFERLARAAILSRPFADKPDWLRFGLPANDEAMERLCAVLEDHG